MYHIPSQNQEKSSKKFLKKPKKLFRSNATSLPTSRVEAIEAWPEGSRKLFDYLLKLNHKKANSPVWIQGYGLSYFAKVF